ncbi:MAG: addiction module antidote protein, HigA family [Acidimicrobiales bacterium]|nr:MAG: addiction module antidote protein, HigA family [Acidimicrobiales bacterium]
MNVYTSKRKPTTVGEILEQEFLLELEITQGKLAQDIKVSRRTINELVNNRRSLSADMALRLSKYFGNSAEFWINLQKMTDLWEAFHGKKAKEIKSIKPLRLNAA